MVNRRSCFNYDFSLSIVDEEEQEQGNENMDKKFIVMATNSFKYRTYEEAETEAKRYTARNDQPYAVAQAISVTKEVVPEIEVVKL